ncbi:hypothetical protein B0T14DRAFT_567680 [Immersiella caudata]|uniref:Uncharacterized protein n=1 Tax=Immersiella caudata TaxID=314043 RepID=A0AA39WSW1_9PEZI|nr:hypothetical protein B0T14DRAFT_567680 [Immersiella caudata]
MANLCSRCEEIFKFADMAFAYPNLERYSFKFVVSSGFSGAIRPEGIAEKMYKWSQQGHGSRMLKPISLEPPLHESDILICEWDHGIPGLGQGGQRPCFALSGGEFFEAGTDYFFLLPLGQRERAAEEDDGGEEESESDDKQGRFDRIEGLILHRSSGKGEYVRVGLFYYTLPHDVREGGNVLTYAFGEDALLDPSGFLQRDGDDGGHTYTIQIV